jgi:hypothetical protein
VVETDGGLALGAVSGGRKKMEGRRKVDKKGGQEKKGGEEETKEKIR